MKLQSFRTERHGGDKWRLFMTATNRMRRPVAISVKYAAIDSPDNLPATMDCCEKDGPELLFAFAEIAWKLGWRPRGLVGASAALVQNFKIPPATN